MGKGGSKKPKMRVTEYFCSVHYGICQGPLDSINHIRINDKIAWRGSVPREAIFNVDNQKLFGGIKKEGGVSGYAVYQPGSMTQYASQTLSNKMGRTRSNMPAYRGIANVLLTGGPSVQSEEGNIEDPLDGGTGFGELENLMLFLFSLGTYKSNGSDSDVGKRRGFYWSANQPYIWPCAFHVTRVPRHWYPETANIYFGSETPRSIYIAIDNSGSMNATRIRTVKEAFRQLFAQLRAQVSQGGMKLNLSINCWADGRNQRTYNLADENDISNAEIFLNNALNGTGGGTDFTQAAQGAVDFFQQSLSQDLDRRIMFLITDGQPNVGTADASQSLMADLLDRYSGQFKISSGTAVDCYAVNIEQSNTTESAKLDNTTGSDKTITTGGAVPNIQEDDPAELSGLIREALGSGSYPSANPAHIIHEALTNRAWGMGANVNSIDDESFRAAADQFFLENFGLSMIWTQQQEIKNFVQEVLDHVEANLYVDPRTGKFVLKPIRDDYDPDTLEVFDESNCTIRNFQRRSPTEITNEINLTWTNPENEEEEVITQQDIGGIVINNGEIISDNRNYYGIRDRYLAANVLARDLATVTAPLATAEIAVNRKAWNYTPASVLKLSSQEHNAEELVMRVAKVNYGKPGDSEIIVSLTQDIFSFARPQIVVPPKTELELDAQEPTLIEYVDFMTLNYFLAANMLAPTVQIGVTYPEVFVGILASTENRDVTSIDVLGETVDAAGNVFTEPQGVIGAISRGRLSTDFEQEAHTVTPGFVGLTAGQGPQQGGFALIGPDNGSDAGRELVMFISNDGDNWTIERGILDTVPRAWPSDTPIRFFSTSSYITDDETETAFAETEYKLAMSTSLGAFPEERAQTETFTPGERPYLPARPANVQIAGVGWGRVDASDIDEIIVTWANRNRLTEDSQVLAWDDPSVAPENGQTTKITIMDADTREVGNEITGLTGESYTLPKSSFGSITRAIVRVTSERDDYESLQGHEIEVITAAGYGFGYGLSYGG